METAIVATASGPQTALSALVRDDLRDRQAKFSRTAEDNLR